MKYRTYANLAATVASQLWRFRRYSVFVGIPRSGMIPALMIGLALNRPVVDLYAYAAGVTGSHGVRGGTIPDHDGPVLVLDDSIASGAEIQKARELLRDRPGIEYGAIYARTSSRDLVDIYCEIIDGRRLFQWNWMHHPILSRSCVDIDGVLCENYDRRNRDYAEFLENAKPMFIPTVKIGALVTSRKREHRDATEKWLSRHGIIYDDLVMMKPDEPSRGHYKAAVYRRRDAALFIESSKREAETIHAVTSRPVLCVDRNKMYA
jgi:hypoxanthine phosphoribosyltransferase